MYFQFMSRVQGGCWSGQKQPPEVFCKKGVLKNFARLTGKHPCQNLFCRPCNFIKKETLAQVFSREFYKIFKTPLDDCFCLKIVCIFRTLRKRSTDLQQKSSSEKCHKNPRTKYMVEFSSACIMAFFLYRTSIRQLVVLLSGVCFCFKYHALKLCTLKEKMFPISLQFQDCVSTRKP